MTQLSRGKIAYNLETSPYETDIYYPVIDDYLKFRFSSELYRSNFENKVDSNRKKINTSLTNRFNISVQIDVLADIKLYSTIEKRGFLIYQNGRRIECLESVKLNGNHLKHGNLQMKKN